MLPPLYSLRVRNAGPSVDAKGVRTVVVGPNMALVDDGGGQVTLDAVVPPVPPATPPGGSAGQVQYNAGGSFGGAARVTYSASGDVLTITAGAATDVPLTIQGFAGQTGNLTEWLNSAGGLLARFAASGALHLHDAGSSRSGVLTFYDGLAAWRFGRSDLANAVEVIAGADGAYHTVRSSTVTVAGIYLLGLGGTLVMTGREDGAHTTVDLNRRPTDNSTGVGGTVRCWTRTGQSQNAFEVLAPGGGSAAWAVRANGSLMPASLADADAANNSVYFSTTANKLVYKDGSGVVNALY